VTLIFDPKKECEEKGHRTEILEVGFVLSEVKPWKETDKPKFVNAAKARRICLRCGKTELLQVGIPHQVMFHALAIINKRAKEVEGADWVDVTDEPQVAAFHMAKDNS